jgi:peptidoglycan hydrolase-like protein with peptidoglycan-binding domain
MTTSLLRVAAVLTLLGLIFSAQLTHALPPIYAVIRVTPEPAAVNAFQSRLQQAGYYNGRVTGVLDLATSVAIARFQATHGLLATGGVDQPTAQALGIRLSSAYMGPAIP